MPNPERTKHLSVLIQSPNRSHFPIQALANGAEDSRRCRFQRIGFGQHARDRVTRRRAALSAFALRHIAGNRKNQLLVAARRRVPQKPDVAAVPAAVAILKRDRLAALDELCPLRKRRCAIIGMDEVNVRTCEKFRRRNSQNLFPGRIHPFEIAVEAGDAQHIQRQREQLIDFLLGAAAFANRLRKIGNTAAKLQFGHSEPAERLQRLALRLPEFARDGVRHADRAKRMPIVRDEWRPRIETNVRLAGHERIRPKSLVGECVRYNQNFRLQDRMSAKRSVPRRFRELQPHLRLEPLPAFVHKADERGGGAANKGRQTSQVVEFLLRKRVQNRVPAERFESRPFVFG